MANPESRFTQNLHKDLLKLDPEFYALKIMTFGNNGVPDSYLSHDLDMWCENKWITLPKRETTEIHPNYSGLQRIWIKRRLKQGRDVATIIGSKEKCCIMHPYFNHDPLSFVFRKDFIHTRKQVAIWLIQHLTHD